MTRRQWTFIGFGAAVVLVAGFAIGFAISSGGPEPSPTPSSTPAAECQVSVTPTTIRVDPDTGASEDILFFAGSGFPPSSAVTIVFYGDTALAFNSTASGDFSAEKQAAPGVTYAPPPPAIEAGPMTWTVTGYDGPQPTDSAGSPPAFVCEVPVTVTIELTHASSATPSATSPTDLSAGDYAEVLADGVRVRATPSTGSTVIGALFTGDVVRILSPAQVVEGLVWYQVETVVLQAGGSPIRGYMAAGADGQSYLVETTAPPPPTPTPSASPSPSPTS
jgi:hypothetical protein